MKKYTSVDWRKGVLYVRACSQTTAGVWIETDSIEKLDSEAPLTEKGEAVLKALSMSVQGIPHPTKWRSDDDDPLWGPGGLAGVSSWRTFVSGASHVSIALDAEGLTFEPWKNEGPKKGFTPLPERHLRLPANASPPEIGAAIGQAFTLCEPPQSQ